MSFLKWIFLFNILITYFEIQYKEKTNSGYKHNSKSRQIL